MAAGSQEFALRDDKALWGQNVEGVFSPTSLHFQASLLSLTMILTLSLDLFSLLAFGPMPGIEWVWL